MSTNPYAAPKAQVADETVVLRSTLIPGGQTVPAGHGWTWIAEAWGLFKAHIGAWIAMIIVLGLIFIGMSLIPFIGALATFVLAPVFTGGLMRACRTIDEGGEMRFSQLFSGFEQRFGPLALIGVVYLAATVLILLVAALVTGVGMFTFLGVGGGSPAALAAAGVAVLLAILIVLALMVPLFMAIWFAPALVVFHDLPAVEAMQQSFTGCLKNIAPFLIYGLIMFGFSILASIPLFLGWLVLGPVMAASIYTGYRDIYLS